MTEPLTDQQLAEIAKEAALVYEHSDYSPQGWDASELAGTVIPQLLAEVARLRAELEQARAAALTEGATELDRIADQAEAEVATRYPGLTGYGSCDMVREAARTLRDMAAAPARA